MATAYVLLIAKWIVTGFKKHLPHKRFFFFFYFWFSLIEGHAQVPKEIKLGSICTVV